MSKTLDEALVILDDLAQLLESCAVGGYPMHLSDARCQSVFQVKADELRREIARLNEVEELV